MKCVVPGPNVKILGRAFQSLSRIGDELFIMPTEDEFKFRTVNSPQSAFTEVNFYSCFFSSYIYNPDIDEGARYKITMKSCLSVFKNLHNPDKQVENCEILLNPDSSRLIFQIKFVNLSVKRHSLSIIDSETVDVAYSKSDSNVITVSSKLLGSCLKNFRHSEDEVTLTVDSDKLLLKNHIDLGRDKNLMRTVLSFQPSDFERFSVSCPSKITFCLREFRAVLMISEPSNLPVTLYFSEPGTPIVFHVTSYPGFEAHYVISTLNLGDMSSRTSFNGSRQNSQVSNGQSKIPVRTSLKRKANDDEDLFEFNNSLVHQCTPLENENNSHRHMVEASPSAQPEENFNQEKEETPQSSNQSSVRRLVETVFGRCFSKGNCIDNLPGHDVVLAEATPFDLSHVQKPKSNTTSNMVINETSANLTSNY